MNDTPNPFEDLIAGHLEDLGPLTGNEIIEKLGTTEFLDVWKACYQSDKFRVMNCARYYLRYDITRENQLRLSPSLLRDFLSFSLVYLADQTPVAVDKSVILANRHRRISLKKVQLARRILLSLDQDIYQALSEGACCFVAGDISYFLAHEEPRENAELGLMVQGSDIDLLIVHENDFSPETIQAVEKQLLGLKYQVLKDPRYRQELDFLLKPKSKMLNQFAYSNINEKIACKILYESFFLFGRLDIYESLIRKLDDAGVTQKIETDFETALQERKTTIGKIFELSGAERDELDPEIQSLFYFSQERLEFE